MDTEKIQTKSMTEGAPWKHILKFSLPVLAGSLLQQLYNTVDTIIVGKYSGEDSLSAVGTTASLAFFFLAVAIGFSSGNGVVVAQHYGAGSEKKSTCQRIGRNPFPAGSRRDLCPCWNSDRKTCLYISS